MFLVGLHKMHVQTQIIRQDPAIPEVAARIVMSETSILSQARNENFTR